MSKIEGLLRRIIKLRKVAPEEKSLVFSQYPDALKLVGKALNVNNINWVELRGGAKVSVHAFFAECPSAELPMLLISMTICCMKLLHTCGIGSRQQTCTWLLKL